MYQTDTSYRRFIQTLKPGEDKAGVDTTTVYTIPVVFVVYHLGESVGTGSNVSEVALQQQLDAMNLMFAGQRPDYGGANLRVRFVMARRSMGCGAFNGVARVDARSVPNYQAGGLSYNDGQMATNLQNLVPEYKSTTSEQYVTIRVVHRTTGFGAWAYYGGNIFVPAYSLTSAGSNNTLLTHEMGHALNLYHTFEGSNNNCPANTNPEMQGDFVADTDPHRQYEPSDACSPTSEAAINNCTGRPFGMIGRNFMSYGCNLKLFTTGQMVRIRSYLAGSLHGLVNSPFVSPVDGVEGVRPITCALSVTRPGGGLKRGISRVQFQTILRNSVYESFTQDNYQDYTCTERTTVTLGQSYSIVINGSGRYRRVYIDFNNDGSFSEEAELAWAAEDQSAGLISIPAGAVTDRYLRMRVMIDDGTTSPTACLLPGHPTEGSGEVEDYAVRVLPADATQTLTLGPTASGYLCLGGQTPISVAYTGTFGPGNTFTVQLSDESGSFANPTPIGSGTTGPVMVTLPGSLPLNNAYKVRVVSSDPVLVSESSPFLTVAELPTATLAAFSTTVSGVLTATMSVSLTGTMPIGFWINKNGTGWRNYSGTLSSPVSFTFVPTSSGVYELANVKNLCGAGTGMGSVTINAPCVAPTGLSENQFSTIGIRTEWTSYVYGNTYTIQWKEISAPTWSEFANVTFSGWILSGFEYGKTYQWRLKLHCSAGDSDWSELRTFTMGCPLPRNPRETTTANAATLFWDGAGEGVTYTLYWRIRGNETWNEAPNLTGGPYTLNNLSASVTYEWQIRSNCPDNGTSAFTPTRQFSTGCLQPVAYSTYQISASSATVNWGGVSGYRYQIRWRAYGSPTWNESDTTSLQWYASLRGLTNNTLYEWQVRAVCSDSQTSAYSSSYTFFTECIVPIGLNTYNITLNSGQLSWSGPTNINYEVRWRAAGVSAWSTTVVSATYYTLNGLSLGIYECQVRALCSASVASDYTSSVYIVPQCFAPTAQGYSSYQNSVDVYYNSFSGGLYQVRWRLVGATTWTESMTLSGSSYTIPNLTVGVTYEWQVRGICANAQSAYSNSATFVLACQVSYNNYTSNIGPTTARLNWASTSGTYELRWRAVGTASWNTVLPVTSTSYALTGLTTGTAYEWQVRTVCSGTVVSTYSPLVMFTAICRLPYNLTENVVTATTAQLTWYVDSGMMFVLQWRPAGTTTWESSGTLANGYPNSITGLSTGTTYEWRVLAECEGTLTPTASRTFTAQCGPPVTGTMYSYYVSSGGATVVWRGPYAYPGVTYRVRYRPTGTTTWTESTTTTPFNSFGLTGLANNTTYEWQVQMSCDGIAGEYSASAPTFTTTCFVPTAYTPSPHDTQVYLYWLNVTGERYNVEYRIPNGADWTTINSLTTSGYMLNVTPGTVYEWRVRAACADGTLSAVSNTVSFTTLPVCDSNEPNNTVPTATPLSGTSFTLTNLCLNRPGDTDWFRWEFDGQTYYILINGGFSNAVGEYGIRGQVTNGVMTIVTYSINGSVTDTYLRLYAADGSTFRWSGDGVNGSVFAQIVYTLPQPCTQMTTLRNGLWTDPGVWSCNRLPLLTDEVRVLHDLSIPYNTTGQAKKVSYSGGGKTRMDTGSKLVLGQ